MRKIVAMLSMSAGNESVGEEWIETKTFEPGETLEAVMRWAATRKYASFADPFAGDGHYIAFNVRLSIDQEATTRPKTAPVSTCTTGRALRPRNARK